MNKVKEFEATEICTKCQGKCCKHMGCHFSPEDFEEISYDALKAEIDKGHISIDWWEGDRPEFFLRMRHVNAPVVDPSWGGRCILLTDEGCPLPFDKRPLGARALEPRKDFRCKTHYSKENCKNDWKKYEDILKKLYKEYRWKELEDN